MSIYNYMKQGINGKNILVCDNLPIKGFIDAVKTYDICKVRIVGRKERVSSGLKPGEPDVFVTSITGERRKITRQQLCKEYMRTNGKNILIAFMRDNKDYIVCNKQAFNTKYKVLKLPSNCSATLRNKPVNGGSYLICPVDEQGNTNENSLSVVSDKAFKRMFKIPMQPALEKGLGIGLIKRTPKYKTSLLKTNEPVKQQGLSLDKQPVKNNILTKSSESTNKLTKSPINNTGNINTGNVNKSKYRFRVINKVVDNNDKTIGFNIQDMKSGNIKTLTLVQTYQLCNQKLVSNLILVKNESTGQSYLKGNGIRLENLPKVLK